MSAKVPNGLLLTRHNLLLKRSEPVGGWYLDKYCSGLYQALVNKKCRWSWDSFRDKEHKGAAMVAPLIILEWDK